MSKIIVRGREKRWKIRYIKKREIIYMILDAGPGSWTDFLSFDIYILQTKSIYIN